MKILVERALTNVTPGDWEKVVRHTLKIENAFQKIDFGEQDSPIIERFTIDLKAGGSETSESMDSDIDDSIGE